VEAFDPHVAGREDDEVVAPGRERLERPATARPGFGDGVAHRGVDLRFRVDGARRLAFGVPAFDGEDLVDLTRPAQVDPQVAGVQ
jgi:hypothetical protein